VWWPDWQGCCPTFINCPALEKPQQTKLEPNTYIKFDSQSHFCQLPVKQFEALAVTLAQHWARAKTVNKRQQNQQRARSVKQRSRDRTQVSGSVCSRSHFDLTCRTQNSHWMKFLVFPLNFRDYVRKYSPTFSHATTMVLGNFWSAPSPLWFIHVYANIFNLNIK